MKNKIVITISREYASGGREIGRILAKKLNIPFYDKELLVYLAKESGLDRELFDHINNQIGFANFYFNDSPDFKLGGGSLRSLNTLSMVQRIQAVQEKIILQYAQESCVLVGRCADYILKNDFDVVSVFICSNLVEKKKRAVNEYGEPLENVNNKLLEVDMKRANYYNYFTDKAWGKANNYDLVINTSQISLEDTANVILELVKCRQNNKSN